ncbi:MAG TPA: hypothetical protein VL137_13075 [Polyangiaceae bacterium]|nr:hypothetical protein [Polyangiaceae bacterium]
MNNCKVWRYGSNGYKNCSYGQNTCRDGIWSICAGADGVAVPPASLDAAVHPLSDGGD